MWDQEKSIKNNKINVTGYRKTQKLFNVPPNLNNKGYRKFYHNVFRSSLAASYAVQKYDFNTWCPLLIPIKNFLSNLFLFLYIFYILASIPEVINRKSISSMLVDVQILILSDAGKNPDITKTNGPGKEFFVEIWPFRKFDFCLEKSCSIRFGCLHDTVTYVIMTAMKFCVEWMY